VATYSNFLCYLSFFSAFPVLVIIFPFSTFFLHIRLLWELQNNCVAKPKGYQAFVKYIQMYNSEL